MKVEATHNPDLIDNSDPLFLTRDQFIDFLVDRGLVIGDSFVGPPITVVDDFGQFEETYLASDYYQSGLVQYTLRR